MRAAVARPAQATSVATSIAMSGAVACAVKCAVSLAMLAAVPFTPAHAAAGPVIAVPPVAYTERTLPNGIVFGARIRPTRAAVRMELWLKNGTTETLTNLRVQNCVMLKGAVGFSAQTNANKVFHHPYVACRSEDGGRWIITAWERCERPWANPPVPCLHSDPKFPDCGPGETKRLKGWLSFYVGTDVESEFKRLDATGWARE